MSNIGESVYFGTSVGLAYKDWTFGVIGAKRWNVDTEDTDSITGRLVLDAWKNYDNYKLGFRMRSEKDYDRYYARAAWNHGMIWGSADVWYESRQGKSDAWRGEFFPIGIQHNGIKLGWFVDYENCFGDLNPGDRKENFEHQLRFYAPLYKGEKLALSTEIRHTLTVDDEYEEKASKNASRYKDFGRNRVYLRADYKATENLNLYVKYGYEIREKEYVLSGETDNRKNYFGDLIVGWNYKF